jgi:alpha-tubulin suppressor-like RCC1 family protein
LAPTEEGQAWTWGTNVHGQCGLRDADSGSSGRQLVVDNPHLVALNDDDAETKGAVRFVAAAAGFNHALLLDGTVN